MRYKKFAIAFALLLLLAPASHAYDYSGLATGVCDALFPSASGGTFGTIQGFDYTSMLWLSFLIVLVSLLVTGILYAISIAFNFEKLKIYVKTESLEIFFNLIFIVLLTPGISAVYGATSFISSLGLAAVSQFQPGTTSLPTTAFDMYHGICDSYLISGVGTTIGGVVSMLPNLYKFQTLQSVGIDVQPNYFGYTDEPYIGLYPWQQVLNVEVEAFLFVGGIMSSSAIFLFIIYYLFPLFLATGILLRSFSWSRAAGGTLLGLFLAFYVVFPALLYPFSVVQLNTPPANPCASDSAITAGIASAGQASCITNSSNAVTEFTWFASLIATPVLQFFGVAIAFIITFDLLERFGDLLGAPALRSGKFLNRVI